MAGLKKEFIDRMAENGDITKKAARQGFDLFIETLMDCMAEDEKVMIKGFGRFEMKTYKERICKSPIGGKNCTIPEHRKMRFYASELLSLPIVCAMAVLEEPLVIPEKMMRLSSKVK